MNELLTKLNSWKPFTAVVVGDFMLDQHVYGAAERLSPDAPVPVLHASRTENQPGGAANVSLCLRALKANVRCCGVIGDDAEGRALRDALQAEQCVVDGFIIDGDRPTTMKRSLIGLAQHRHPQKMFRLDYESRRPLSEDVQRQLLRQVEVALADADVVCLEDYGKGVCTERVCQEIVALCRQRGCPLLVDPAAIDDFSRYRGATAITPNRSEAELATGREAPTDGDGRHAQQLASSLLESLELDAVVLTLDKDGAMLLERGGRAVHVPTVARAVYDVTGAGDMVLAALSGAVTNGMSWHEAVQLANAAAGLEVEEFGVKPIPLARIQREILMRSRSLDGKVRSMDELLIELRVHRDAGRRIVLTNGCFDVIHAGHVAYLREAKQIGDVLVVAVNNDAQVRALKGNGRPIYAERERLEILEELQCIDYLIVFSEPTASEVLRQVRPDIWVKGGDYTLDQIAERDVVKELQIEFRLLSERPGLGSTQVIQRMREIEKQPSA